VVEGFVLVSAFAQFRYAVAKPEEMGGVLVRVVDADLLGAGEFEQRSRSTGEKGRRLQTKGNTYRELAPANVVRERDPGTGLLCLWTT
jgi:hypothetical protein